MLENLPKILLGISQKFPYYAQTLSIILTQLMYNTATITTVSVIIALLTMYTALS